MGLEGGLNPYAYVGSNPVNAVDPMGLYFNIDFSGMLNSALNYAGNFAAGFNSTVTFGLTDIYLGKPDYSNPATYAGEALGIGLGMYTGQSYFTAARSTVSASATILQRQATVVISRKTVTEDIIRHSIPDDRASHIFRNAEGHLLDSPANRQLLHKVADDPATTLGKDKYGSVWSALTQPNGTQVWTQARSGKIINGGLNEVPRSFNPQTGLSKLNKPTK